MGRLHIITAFYEQLETLNVPPLTSIGFIWLNVFSTDKGVFNGSTLLHSALLHFSIPLYPINCSSFFSFLAHTPSLQPLLTRHTAEGGQRFIISPVEYKCVKPMMREWGCDTGQGRGHLLSAGVDIFPVKPWGKLCGLKNPRLMKQKSLTSSLLECSASLSVQF